jgi:hypothetical protein
MTTTLIIGPASSHVRRHVQIHDQAHDQQTARRVAA